MLTNYIRHAGNGLTKSGQALSVDTAAIATRARVQKGIDSVATLATAGVTSVATGYGLSGGTITTTGTISADTLQLSTRAWRQKGLDSLAALEISGSGTTNYVPKFTGTSTIGNSTIFDDGEVKINTVGDSGNYKFQVNGSILSNTDITIRSNTPRIFFSDADNNGDHFIQGDGNSLLLYADNLNKADNSAIKFYVDNVQQMTLTKDGYLGIGNNSPETKVEIAIPNSGAIATALQVKNYAFAVNANGEGVQIGFANNRNFGSVNSSTITSTTSNFSNGASDLYFSTWSGSSLVERFRTTSNGELLLNTTTDAGDYKLQVSGNAYVTGTTVLAATSGSVGVGVVSPSTKLEINGTARASRLNSTGGIVDFDSQSGGNFISISSGTFSFANAGAVSFIVNSDKELIINGTDQGNYKLQALGNVYSSGTYTSAAPTDGTAAPWRLGSYVTTAPTATGFVQVEINGVKYKLLAATY
jgi:hypothetical protein